MTCHGFMGSQDLFETTRCRIWRKLSWLSLLSEKNPPIWGRWNCLLLASQAIPSGKLSHNYGKSHFFNGQIHYKWAIFNSYVKLAEGKIYNDPQKIALEVFNMFKRFQQMRVLQCCILGCIPSNQ